VLGNRPGVVGVDANPVAQVPGPVLVAAAALVGLVAFS
jgi:hypothetical protein